MQAYTHTSASITSHFIMITDKQMPSMMIQIMNGYECNGTDIFMR